MHEWKLIARHSKWGMIRFWQCQKCFSEPGADPGVTETAPPDKNRTIWIPRKDKWHVYTCDEFICQSTLEE